MLIYYGVYADIGTGGMLFLLILYLTAGVCFAFLKRTKRQIIVLSVCITALIVCEIGMIVPTPSWLAGDGYAVTQDLSLIIASYLVPIVLGMITCGLFKIIIILMKRGRAKE